LLSTNFYVGYLVYTPVTNSLFTGELRRFQTSRNYYQIIVYKNTSIQLAIGTEFLIKNSKGFEFIAGCEYTVFSGYEVYEVKFKMSWNF
jgi:hypothetical protein